jgi:hypothetical protein
MIRTAAAVLALAVLGAASAANAAQYTVQTAGKSPAQVRADVTAAAYKACDQAYASDVLIAYERDACVRDSVQAALSKAPQTALNASSAAHDVAAVTAR